jgi:hypothetical protein
MSTEALYWAALSAAFWLALWTARPTGMEGRLVAGLALGGALARAGGLLLAPAGLLLAAPRGSSQRLRFLDATLPALPLAFAAAKLGCLAAGCCPVAGAEALGFAALAGCVGRAPPRFAAPAALAGIGLVRLAALPFRPEATGSALPAALWLALGALRCLPPARGARCPPPGNEISRPPARRSRPGCAAGSATPASSP